MANATVTAEAEIRERINDWAEATRAKDVDRIIASHAPHTMSFDCHSHLQFTGAAALRRLMTSNHLQASGGSLR